MKIAIYHNIPSGGAKRALYEQVQRLAAEHELDLYYLSTNREDFLDLRPIVRRAYRYTFFALHRKRIWQAIEWVAYMIESLAFIPTARRIARDIEQRGYDIVYIHQCEFSHIPVIARYISRIPTVVYCQEPWRALYEPRMLFASRSTASPVLPLQERILRVLWAIQWPFSRWMKRHDRQNIQAAKKVLANSRYSQTYIRQAYGVDSEVQYLGMNEQVFTPAPTSSPIQPPYVVSVGGIAPAKGFDQTIEALGLVPSDIRPTLIIAADRTSGSVLEHYIRELARRLSVTLEIRTRISDQELVALYRGATALVYTPVREPFGLVAIEAMACGTPVVGVREGGLTETIRDHVNGLLVDRQAEALAGAIRQILTDDELRNELSQAARGTVVPKFTWDASVRNLVSIFQTLRS